MDWRRQERSYIVNRNKVMITGSRFIEGAIYNQVVDTEGVRTAFDNRTGMTGIYPDYRDIPVLGVSKYIEEMDWVIVASKNVSEAFAPDHIFEELHYRYWNYRYYSYRVRYRLYFYRNYKLYRENYRSDQKYCKT